MKRSVRADVAGAPALGPACSGRTRDGRARCILSVGHEGAHVAIVVTSFTFGRERR